jgi:hypothetical protein
MKNRRDQRLTDPPRQLDELRRLVDARIADNEALVVSLQSVLDDLSVLHDDDELLRPSPVEYAPKEDLTAIRFAVLGSPPHINPINVINGRKPHGAKEHVC